MNWRAKNASFTCRCTQGGPHAKITRRGKRRSVTVTKPKMEVANCRTQKPFLLSNSHPIMVGCEVCWGGLSIPLLLLFLALSLAGGCTGWSLDKNHPNHSFVCLLRFQFYLLASLLTYLLLSTFTWMLFYVCFCLFAACLHIHSHFSFLNWWTLLNWTVAECFCHFDYYNCPLYFSISSY